MVGAQANGGRLVRESLAKSGDPGFFGLLLHLIHEHGVLGPRSRWWPYIRLLPKLDEIKPPFTYVYRRLKSPPP